MLHSNRFLERQHMGIYLVLCVVPSTNYSPKWSKTPKKKPPSISLEDFFVSEKVERKTGFEPATFSLARRCSTTEPLPLIYRHG